MRHALNVNPMTSFSVRAMGYLARDPDLVVAEEGSSCRFCLMSESCTEDDKQSGFAVVVESVWFVATHLVGAAIADSARKGDQLFVEGKTREKPLDGGGECRGRHVRGDGVSLWGGERAGTRGRCRYQSSSQLACALGGR